MQPWAHKAVSYSASQDNTHKFLPQKSDKLLIFTKNATRKYLWDDFPFKNKNIKEVLGKGKPSSTQTQHRLNFLPQTHPPNINSFEHTSSSPELPYILTGAAENSRSGLLQFSLQTQLAKAALFLLERSWLKSSVLNIAHMKAAK